MTQPATTQELIADVLLPYFGDDEIAYTAADAIVRDPAITIRPRRIITGEWRDVRDALDKLPMGAQIRWTTGEPIHTALGINRGAYWNVTTHGGPLTSYNIARDNTPIEVLA